MLTLVLAVLIASAEAPAVHPDAVVPIRSAASTMQPAGPCGLSNLVVTWRLRPVLDLMARTSPTFRAQCARLRQAPTVLVTVGDGNQSQVGARGRVLFVRSAGEMVRAEVLVDLDLRALSALVEVLAHEIEHVIEQLDGVELKPDSTQGVHRTGSGAFETARAVHIGRAVHGEVEAGRRSLEGPRPR